jgi:tRNA(Ile2)-agmatinylcytidine synthase
VLTELLRIARELSLDLIGDARLVRLNPNIPWKTRGNAALGATLGRGTGARRRVGAIDGTPVWSYARVRPGRPAPREEEFFEAAWTRICRTARLGEPGTDPALVVSRSALPAELYWRAVREVVPVRDVRRALDRARARYRTEGSERGLIGATAALAWRAPHPTWEVIAYRSAERWGTPRDVDAASVRRAQRAHPELFLCFDAATRRLLVAPHTPCPILFGLRATAPDAALAARPRIASEPVDRWLLFRTNQGTGDHLKPRPVRDLAAYTSGVVDGRVAGSPVALPGGHVRFPLQDAEGTVAECFAFEPTKTLPRVAAALRGGDRVRVWGSRGREPGIRLEGIRVLRLAPPRPERRGPRCGTCGHRTGSLGQMRGYRCPRCRRRYPPESAAGGGPRRTVALGEYHPTPSARRHLAPRGPEP